MARAMRRMGESLRLVDVVIEAVDARVARSGSNPSLHRLAAHKRRLVVLTRSDLADPKVTRAWLRAFEQAGIGAIAIDAREPRAVARIAALLKSQPGDVRAMVVGIPNAGKSTIVNALVKRAAAKTERRAGVTRRTQWFRLAPGVEIMDTPGVLAPKIASAQAQWRLAAVGAVPSERYDPEAVAQQLQRWAEQHGVAGVPTLERFSSQRGFIRRGGKVDAHAAAQSYLRAFEHAKFGRISLDVPDDAEAT